MSEAGNLNVSEPNDKGLPRLKRKMYEHRWVIAVCTLAFFVFYLPVWDGGSNLGTAAWFCSMSVAITIEGFWKSRRKLWFPITVSLIVVAHVLVFSFVHWTKEHYLGGVYRGVMTLDFCLVYFVMWLARGIAGDGWSDEPGSNGRVETEQRLDLLAHD